MTWLLFVLQFMLVFAVMLALFRYVRRSERRRVLNLSATALIGALTSATAADAISEKDAAKVFFIWDHFLTIGPVGVPCACRSVVLHCENDEAVVRDIKHTTEFCDVP